MAAVEVPQTLEYRGCQLNVALVLEDFQDSPDDEEDTRSSHEYLNDLEEEYQAKALLAKSKRFFKKEEVSSDDEETEVKALMELTDEERISVGKESARNGEWTKFTIKKYINEQIPSQKKKILRIGQLTEYTSSCGSKDLVFVKSLADNSDMSITSSNLHKSSEVEDSTLPNHDTDEVPSNKSQRNTTDPSTVVSDSPASDYDSTDESSVCSTPFLPLKKLDGAEPGSGLKTVKSILKSKSTFKAKTLKGITLNEPSPAPARGNKISSASKTNSAPAGKLKNVKVEDDPPLAMSPPVRRACPEGFKTSVPSYQSPFQSKLLLSSENKLELRQTKDFEAKYHKVKAKLALLSSTPNSSSGKNKGLIAETYDWDDEEVSSDENEVTEVKALMALTDEERVSVGKESARNDYLCIDLNYVEEQRNNLLSKYRNLVQELNTCKEQLLVLKQAKLDLLTMQHVNTEILKENQNLRLELKELTSITETWLNSSNKVNQCINEQIPTQKKKILGINQLTEDTSSFRSKDPVFVKSLADNPDMSITSSNIPKSSETEDSTLPNQDTDEVPSNESQRNTTDPLVVISDSSATDYDSADESLVCSTPLLFTKKLDGCKPVSGPKTIKSILKLKSTFKAETLKGITINKPSSAPARGKSSSASKTNSAPAGKLKNVKMEDDPPLAIVNKDL
ncbi:hypothetical protein Tco_0633590 [Tanacetum coccineum]